MEGWGSVLLLRCVACILVSHGELAMHALELARMWTHEKKQLPFWRT